MLSNRAPFIGKPGNLNLSLIETISLKFVSKISAFLTLFCISNGSLFSQDIEQIGKHSQPELNGYVSSSQILTCSLDIVSGIKPQVHYTSKLKFIDLGVKTPRMFLNKKSLGVHFYFVVTILNNPTHSQV